MLETLLNGLRDLHRNHEKGHGRKRSETIQEQAEYACAFARENSLLVEPEYSFSDLTAGNIAPVSGEVGLVRGAEHVVELDGLSGRMKKFTIPSGFGLTPKLLHHEVANASLYQEHATTKPSIEFVEATPLEYLTRWHACNELFHDDVQLTTIILWPNGDTSFGITQPQYGGNIPDITCIEEYFTQAGWTRVKNALHHTVFYNYAFQLLALDIEPRNCYISDDGNLLPFDVILSEPDDELSDFLKLY